MKILVYVFCCGILVTGAYADKHDSNTTMVLTKFQKRAIKIKQMNDAAEAEAKQLEEDGFCPCSVQKP